MNVHPDLPMWMLNMHDVLLNARLQRRLMKEAAIAPAEEFDVFDRGRLERGWVRDLYVLVEAWQRHPTLRAELASWVDTTDVERLLILGAADRHLAHMAEVRHYMSHRDKREYWDRGRTATMQPGALAFHEAITLAFSKVLLAALRTVPHTPRGDAAA